MISNESKDGSIAQTPLYGLVLAGGKSKRMGFDKGAIKWHGKEQRYYMTDLLHDLCSEVFISCRPEQQNKIDHQYKTIPDSYTALGPYGAILSAFKQSPEVAWLVIASDLPLMDATTLQYLVQQRSTTSIATTFESPFDHLPEPLITIWEPASYPVLLSFLSEGLSCPRKTLIRNEGKVKLITAANPDALINANTPEDAGKVKEILAGKV